MVDGEWNAYEEEERKRGSPSAISKCNISLLLDYKTQGGGSRCREQGKVVGLCRTRKKGEEGDLQKGKGRVKSSTRKNDPQNEGKGKGEGAGR